MMASQLEQGIEVLRLAADKGNRPAQAVIDELNFRQNRINVLHEINSDLNARLRDARQELATLKFMAQLANSGSVDLSNNGADPMEELTHAD